MSINPQNKEPLEIAQQHMRAGNYDAAEPVLAAHVRRFPQELSAQRELARCWLAGGKTKAVVLYQQLADCADNEYRGEAMLVLNRRAEALIRLHAAVEADGGPEDTFLLYAAAAYKNGKIRRCSQTLVTAAERGIEWDDDASVTIVLKSILTLEEFHDLEQLYLDAIDTAMENVPARNRWFGINMPIFEFLTAATEEKRRQKAAALVEFLSSPLQPSDLSHGQDFLRHMIAELAQNPDNIELASTAEQLLQEHKLHDIAKLILGLLLSHLSQFIGYFDMDEKDIAESSLQQLAQLLPLKIAAVLIFLYSVSNPQDNLINYANPLTDDNTLAGLIAAAFIAFYQQVDLYRFDH